MKTHALILAAVLALAASFQALASKPKATMECTEKVFDFGNIPEQGGPVSHSFDFTNTGGANLVIIDARADCGCTTPSYPKKPLSPGESGKISVKYNPIGRPGAFDKVITVRTNGKPSKLHLKIRGQVVPKAK